MSNPSPFTPLLLIRPLPDPCENTPEYLHRLAKENGFNSGNELAAVFGVPFGHISSHSPAKVLAVIQGRDARQSLRLPPHSQPSTRHFGITVGISLSARVCSRCLSESDTLSAKWSLPLSISCDKHKTALLDRCPTCLRSIRRTKSPYRCRCGQDFREVASQPGPLWEESYYELFAPWRLVPSLSVSAMNLFRVETLAGRMTRRLIRSYELKTQIQMPKPQDPPQWWIRSVDHPVLEAICQNDEALADTTLRLFPQLTTFARNLYVNLTAEITDAQPRILLLALQLDAERGISRPRTMEQKRAARKARINMLREPSAAMNASPGAVSSLQRVP